MTNTVIVGGGLGGLLLADKLASAGWPVTVLERSADFGGGSRFVEQHGRRWPTAIYSSLGFEPGSRLAELAGRPLERFVVSDHVFLDGRELPLPGTVPALEHRLGEWFPQERLGLGRFFRTLDELYRAIDASLAVTDPAGRMRALGVLQQYGRRTYRDLRDELIRDPDLRRLLAVRAFSSTNTASTMLAYLAKIHFDGLYPIAGPELAGRLVARLSAAGSTCRLLRGVEATALEIEPAERRANAVHGAGGERFPADEIVLGCDLGPLAGDFVADPEARAAFSPLLAGYGPGLSAITCQFALDPRFRPRLARFAGAARIYVADDADPFDVLLRREAGQLDLGTFKINLDLAGAEPLLGVEIDAAPEAVTDGVPGTVARRVRERLERLLPGFAAAVQAEVVFTPADYQAWSGARAGTASGFRDAAARPFLLYRALERRGLLSVGQWSMFGSGLSQLELSAQTAFQSIRRRAMTGARSIAEPVP